MDVNSSSSRNVSIDISNEELNKKWGKLQSNIQPIKINMISQRNVDFDLEAFKNGFNDIFDKLKGIKSKFKKISALNQKLNKLLATENCFVFKLNEFKEKLNYKNLKNDLENFKSFEEKQLEIIRTYFSEFFLKAKQADEALLKNFNFSNVILKKVDAAKDVSKTLNEYRNDRNVEVINLFKPFEKTMIDLFSKLESLNKEKMNKKASNKENCSQDLKNFKVSFINLFKSYNNFLSNINYLSPDLFTISDFTIYKNSVSLSESLMDSLAELNNLHLFFTHVEQIFEDFFNLFSNYKKEIQNCLEKSFSKPETMSKKIFQSLLNHNIELCTGFYIRKVKYLNDISKTSDVLFSLNNKNIHDIFGKIERSISGYVNSLNSDCAMIDVLYENLLSSYNDLEKQLQDIKKQVH